MVASSARYDRHDRAVVVVAIRYCVVLLPPVASSASAFQIARSSRFGDLRGVPVYFDRDSRGFKRVKGIGRGGFELGPSYVEE